MASNIRLQNRLYSWLSFVPWIVLSSFYTTFQALQLRYFLMKIIFMCGKSYNRSSQHIINKFYPSSMMFKFLKEMLCIFISHLFFVFSGLPQGKGNQKKESKISQGILSFKECCNYLNFVKQNISVLHLFK